MTSDGIYPTVIYTTSFKNGVHCKQWNGKEWVSFGTFPEVKERGFVAIKHHFLSQAFYALVQDGMSWKVFKKEVDQWEVISEMILSTRLFVSPTLSFIDSIPYIYEQHHSTREINMYVDQNGILQPTTIAGKEQVASDFRMHRNSMEYYGAYLSKNNRFRSFKVYKWGTKTKSKKIKKGVNKKEVEKIIDLMEYNSKLYIHWLDQSWNLHSAVYNEYKDHWKEITQQDSSDGLGFYFTSNQSYVTKSKTNDLPVFFEFDGKKWKSGVQIGDTKIFHGSTVRLVEGLGASYYLLNCTEGGDCVVQEIDN